MYLKLFFVCFCYSGSMVFSPALTNEPKISHVYVVLQPSSTPTKETSVVPYFCQFVSTDGKIVCCPSPALFLVFHRLAYSVSLQPRATESIQTMRSVFTLKVFALSTSLQVLKMLCVYKEQSKDFVALPIKKQKIIPGISLAQVTCCTHLNVFQCCWHFENTPWKWCLTTCTYLWAMSS